MTLLAAQVYVRLRKPKALAALDNAEGTPSRPAGLPSELHSFKSRSLRGPIKTTGTPGNKSPKMSRYLDERATRAMAQHRHASKRKVQVMITIGETKGKVVSQARNWSGKLQLSGTVG